MDRCSCGEISICRPSTTFVATWSSNVEKVGAVQVVPLRPLRAAGLPVDELHRHADHIRGALVGSFQNAVDSQRFRGLGCLGSLLGVLQDGGRGRTARFFNEVNRLMMASVMPMAQLSLWPPQGREREALRPSRRTFRGVSG